MEHNGTCFSINMHKVRLSPCTWAPVLLSVDDSLDILLCSSISFCKYWYDEQGSPTNTLATHLLSQGTDFEVSVDFGTSKIYFIKLHCNQNYITIDQLYAALQKCHTNPYILPEAGAVSQESAKTLWKFANGPPPPKHIAIPSVRGRSGSGWTMVKEVSDDSQVSGRGKSASHSVQPIKMQRTQLWTGSNSTVVANCTKVGKEQSLECNDYFRMTTGIRDIQKAIGMYTILTGQQIALGLLPLSSLLHHDTSLFYPHQCGWEKDKGEEMDALGGCRGWLSCLCFLMVPELDLWLLLSSVACSYCLGKGAFFLNWKHPSMSRL